MSLLTLEAKLERTGTTPWGFRMQGGKDFCIQLTIQRINPGSMAEKSGLHVGDVILKIGNADTAPMRHKDAQDAIFSAGNKLKLLLQRGGVVLSRDPNNYEMFSTSNPNTGSFQNPCHVSQSYNTASKGYTSNPSAYNPLKVGELSDRMHNVSLSSSGGTNQFNTCGSVVTAVSGNPSSLPPPPPSLPTHPPPPPPPAAAPLSLASCVSIADRYSEHEQVKPANPQSRSFMYLQELMDSGKEPPAVLTDTTPPALHQRSVSPFSVSSSQPFTYKQNEPPAHVGTGEVNVPQSCNTPVAPYCSETMSQKDRCQGQLSLPVSGLDRAMPSLSTATPSSRSPDKPSSTSRNKSLVKDKASVAKLWSPITAPNGPQQLVDAGVEATKPLGFDTKRVGIGEAVFNKPTANQIPVCYKCHTSIRGPFVSALGKSWCPDHFVCANPQCGVKLLNVGFVEDGGHLYCERDYSKFFAPHCKHCSLAIIGECVNALQSTWHPDCFLCAHCNKPIGGNQFHLEGGKPYCNKDWAALFRTMCSSCDFPVEPGDGYVEAIGKNFHVECFNCTTCQMSLESQPFVVKAGKVFCKKHAQ